MEICRQIESFKTNTGPKLYSSNRDPAKVIEWQEKKKKRMYLEAFLERRRYSTYFISC